MTIPKYLNKTLYHFPIPKPSSISHIYLILHNTSPSLLSHPHVTPSIYYILPTIK